MLDLRVFSTTIRVMKIKKEHLIKLKQGIDAVLSNKDISELVHDYETGNFPRSEKVRDLQKRFAYDILRASGQTSFICDVLYKYLNDDHIYTALRSIVPQVKKKY